MLRASKELGVPLAVLQDLQGPRIRVGMLPPEGRMLHDGETVVFSTAEESDPAIIHVDEPYLHADIHISDPMLLASGEMELVVRSIDGTRISCEVIRGGVLFSRKGVNVPRTKLTMSGLTDKDRRDVVFALTEGVDYVAVSFVQTAHDMEKLRELVGAKAKTIAKIETPLALDAIDGIMRASDAVMIARGDLGIEMPLEQLRVVDLLVPVIERGLAVDDQDRVYVADAGHGRVLVLQASTTFDELTLTPLYAIEGLSPGVYDIRFRSPAGGYIYGPGYSHGVGRGARRRAAPTGGRTRALRSAAQACRTSALRRTPPAACGRGRTGRRTVHEALRRNQHGTAERLSPRTSEGRARDRARFSCSLSCGRRTHPRA